MDRETEAGSALLDARSLRKDFGGIVAVDSFSFSVRPGQIVAIIGPNGAGKTTVFNLVTGVHPLTAGEIHFGGQRIDALKPYQIAEKGISRTFQNLQIFGNMTVVENVMVGRHSRSKVGILSGALSLPSSRSEEKRIYYAAMEMLDMVGLVSRAKQPASALPFGSQRLLELARALANEPKLLLLDEPAAGLASQETRNLERLIYRIRDGGVSILLVEHDMELVMGIADWVFVLDYGKLIAAGTPRDIQANEKVIAAYLGDETD
ncbi:MAG: ABC transporter ATP-binding protein [Chloroflexi bacterium]|nr:ABC transporter ATP-binding protein [Chloroflexota bacterium]